MGHEPTNPQSPSERGDTPGARPARDVELHKPQVVQPDSEKLQPLELDDGSAPASVASNTPISAAPERAVRQCPACNKLLAPSDVVCVTCGTRIKGGVGGLSAKHRKTLWVCGDCGYDVTATPGLPCPECGSDKRIRPGEVSKVEAITRDLTGKVGPEIVPRGRIDGRPEVGSDLPPRNRPTVGPGSKLHIDKRMNRDPKDLGATYLCTDCGEDVTEHEGEPCPACGCRGRTTPERLEARERLGRVIVMKFIATSVGLTLLSIVWVLLTVVIGEADPYSAVFAWAFGGASVVVAAILIFSFLGWEEPIWVTLIKCFAIGTVLGAFMFWVDQAPGLRALNILGCHGAVRAVIVAAMVRAFVRAETRDSIIVGVVTAGISALLIFA